MSESTLERYLVKKVREAGGECIKLTGVKGLPDRLALLPGGRTVFIELKSPGGTGRLSKMQRHWIERLKDLGFNAVVIDSKEKVQRFVGIY